MKKLSCTKEIIKTLTDGLFMFGDCVESAKKLLSDFSGKITLIYLDPPFCTGNNFKTDFTCAYKDHMPENEYMSMMRDLLTLSRCLLSDEGSIYLHIDYRMSAKLRLLLDDVFGADNFRNEIIWSYKSGGNTKKHFPRKHDTIFFYSKTDSYYFNIDATGSPRGKDRRNNMKKCKDENGRIYFSINSHGKEYRYYEDDVVPPTDVWTDIEHLHQKDAERTGYPTQKPLALLSRIISASSYEDSYVCDFFSGSGTTAHAASLLGRRFIAADNSPLALLSLKKRLPCGTKDSVILHSSEYQTVNPHFELQSGVLHAVIDGGEVKMLSVGTVNDGIYTASQTSDTDSITFPSIKNLVVSVTDNAGRVGFFIMEDEI